MEGGNGHQRVGQYQRDRGDRARKKRREDDEHRGRVEKPAGMAKKTIVPASGAYCGTASKAPNSKVPKAP